VIGSRKGAVGWLIQVADHLMTFEVSEPEKAVAVWQRARSARELQSSTTPSNNIRHGNSRSFIQKRPRTLQTDEIEHRRPGQS
jgi:hypothetical protein